MPHPDMEWMDLFGLAYTDEAVTAFLSKHPPHKAEKPSDGSQYIVCRAGGFDLLFDTRHAESAPATSKRQDRRLSGIFFYNDGVDKHQRYSGPLPLGFAFVDGRAGLLRKHTPERTWVIGEGRVPVDHPEPDHDRWDFAPLQISAHYGDGTEIRYFTVSQPSGKPEWKPAETWQSLALLPERKADAIKLYRDKYQVGIAEAKLAVEQHAAQAGGG